jgi:hypothetical protein
MAFENMSTDSLRAAIRKLQNEIDRREAAEEASSVVVDTGIEDAAAERKWESEDEQGWAAERSKANATTAVVAENPVTKAVAVVKSAAGVRSVSHWTGTTGPGRWYADLKTEGSFRGDSTSKLFIDSQGRVVEKVGAGKRSGAFRDAVDAVKSACEAAGVEYLKQS